MRNAEYWEGYDAYCRGDGHNPYCPDTGEYESWELGYQTASEDE